MGKSILERRKAKKALLERREAKKARRKTRCISKRKLARSVEKQAVYIGVPWSKEDERNLAFGYARLTGKHVDWNLDGDVDPDPDLREYLVDTMTRETIRAIGKILLTPMFLDGQKQYEIFLYTSGDANIKIDWSRLDSAFPGFRPFDPSTDKRTVSKGVK
jgi:hypothetical protein